MFQKDIFADNTFWQKNRQKCKEYAFCLYMLGICIFYPGAFPLMTKVTSIHAPNYEKHRAEYAAVLWILNMDLNYAAANQKFFSSQFIIFFDCNG